MSGTDLSGKFPRPSRLTTQGQFRAVFAYRCATNSGRFTVWARPNGLELSRLGIVAPRVAIRTSVGRNYAKRVVRECFRVRQTELSGLDIVVRIRAQLDGGQPALLSELVGLLRRARRCR